MPRGRHDDGPGALGHGDQPGPGLPLSDALDAAVGGDRCVSLAATLPAPQRRPPGRALGRRTSGDQLGRDRCDCGRGSGERSFGTEMSNSRRQELQPSRRALILGQDDRLLLRLYPDVPTSHALEGRRSWHGIFRCFAAHAHSGIERWRTGNGGGNRDRRGRPDRIGDGDGTLPTRVAGRWNRQRHAPGVLRAGSIDRARRATGCWSCPVTGTMRSISGTRPALDAVFAEHGTISPWSFTPRRSRRTTGRRAIR